jgi:hypothetical protein
MTTLILNGSSTLPALAIAFRMWLSRLGRMIDRAVSARAARAVPEWQLRAVDAEIRRYLRPARKTARRA